MNEITPTDFKIDELMKKLENNRLSFKTSSFCLIDKEISAICSTVYDIFLNQPTLLRLEAPIKVLGDIHGQFKDLMTFLDQGLPVHLSQYLFLGDYVDRGEQSLETILYLFCLKIKFPNQVFILRGNHESNEINKFYGFHAECRKRVSGKVIKGFSRCFSVLPLAAVISDKIFCVHGGISPKLKLVEEIERIKRPILESELFSGLACDLLWSDPNPDIAGFIFNEERKLSHMFGSDVLDEFLEINGFDLLCRAHQVMEDGYLFMWGWKLITIFSAPNYCNLSNNSGAMITFDEHLTGSIFSLRPISRQKELEMANFQ